MVILLYAFTQHAERLHQFADTLEGPAILIDCMIFLSPFLDVKRMAMSTDSRLVLVVN